MTRCRLALLTIAIAFAFTACGGSNDTSSGDGTTVPGPTAETNAVGDGGSGGATTSAGLDVCALFTQTDAEDVFDGTKMTAESVNVENTCSFESDDPADGASVMVMYQPRALADGTVEEIATMAEDQLPGEAEGAVAPVDGIDGAFSLHKEGLAQVLIPHNDGIVTVSAVKVIGDNDNLASSVALAEVIAGNL